MGHSTIKALFVINMVLVVVGVDVAFFRGGAWLWARLAANVGIVLLAGAFYFRFLAP